MPDLPRDEPEDARPWERPGAVRRDCEPHRGVLLWRLATTSVICGLTAPALGMTALVGAALGLAVYWLAGCDLRAMSGGRMDPAGRDQTEWARSRAGLGIAVNVCGLAACGLLIPTLGPILGFYLAG